MPEVLLNLITTVKENKITKKLSPVSSETVIKNQGIELYFRFI